VGPAGPQGLPGPAGGETLYVADEPISALRVVRLSSSGHVRLARPEEAESHSPLGVSLQAAASGGTLSVALQGQVQDNSWAWIPGQSVFLGANGTLTSVQQNLNVAIVVGTASAPTSLMVRIQPPLFLL
jgi:hypothetical protein